jgi:TonB family protein
VYFDLEDYRPDISPVGSAISWREGLLLSVIAHLGLVILLLVAPELFQEDPAAREARLAKLEAELAERRPEDRARFVFVEPRVDLRSERAPNRAELSDENREARAPERAKTPTNPLPFSRGNSSERVEQAEREVMRGPVTETPAPAPEPDTTAGQADDAARRADSELQVPQAESPLPVPPRQQADARLGRQGGGSLGEALRNLQRYVQPNQFDNRQGGGGAFGPAIQFDTKGVEFGPWVRRFVAQVKGNWLIPYAAMSMHGRVVITFNVHKNGFITDLEVVGPSPVQAFNQAAYGALAASNPTAPLPSEYPADKAFFTVTFFYNEEP